LQSGLIIWLRTGSRRGAIAIYKYKVNGEEREKFQADEQVQEKVRADNLAAIVYKPTDKL
jgi:hypothetical protein